MTTETDSQEMTVGGCEPAVLHFRELVAGGKHWFVGLLEAIGICEVKEEFYQGRFYRYIIAGEAFDWLLMAERILQEASVPIPEDEKTALLFESKLPVAMSLDEFKKLIGAKKHRQYLNYFYGITVEEALIQKVHEEVRKERQAHGYRTDFDNEDEVYARIYGNGKIELLRQFRKEKGYPASRVTSLTEMKEFTYWLFKLRVRQAEPAKVASDTKKALSQLKSSGFTGKVTEGRKRKVVTLEPNP